MKQYHTLNLKRRPKKNELKPSILRKQGHLPGVIFGDGMDSILFQVDQNEWNKFIRFEERVFKISLDGEETLVALAEIAREPHSQKALHLSFQKLDKNQKTTLSIPLHIIGEAKGALNQNINEIMVEGKPSDIPQFFEIDISFLKQGDHLTVADLKIPSNIKALSGPNQVLIGCVKPKIEVVTPEEEKVVSLKEGPSPETKEKAS